MAVKNIMIVGVGGQGTLLTSRVLGGLAIAGVAGRAVRVQGTVIDILRLLEKPAVRLRVQQELLFGLAFGDGSIAGPDDLGSMGDGKQNTTEEKHYGKEPNRGLLYLHLFPLPLRNYLVAS